MKVKFCHDNNANIHSKKTMIFDTLEDFGLSDVDWKSMPEEEKMKIVQEWALPDFEYWFEEQ